MLFGTMNSHTCVGASDHRPCLAGRALASHEATAVGKAPTAALAPAAGQVQPGARFNLRGNSPGRIPGIRKTAAYLVDISTPKRYADREEKHTATPLPLSPPAPKKCRGCSRISAAKSSASSSRRCSKPRSMPRSNAFDTNAGRMKRSKAIAMATTDRARSHRTADRSRCVARAYVVPLSNQKRCLLIAVDCNASINP